MYKDVSKYYIAKELVIKAGKMVKETEFDQNGNVIKVWEYYDD